MGKLFKGSAGFSFYAKGMGDGIIRLKGDLTATL